jgi:hypothetical protein
MKHTYKANGAVCIITTDYIHIIKKIYIIYKKRKEAGFNVYKCLNK